MAYYKVTFGHWYNDDDPVTDDWPAEELLSRATTTMLRRQALAKQKRSQEDIPVSRHTHLRESAEL